MAANPMVALWLIPFPLAVLVNIVPALALTSNLPSWATLKEETNPNMRSAAAAFLSIRFLSPQEAETRPRYWAAGKNQHPELHGWPRSTLTKSRIAVLSRAIRECL